MAAKEKPRLIAYGIAGVLDRPCRRCSKTINPGDVLWCIVPKEGDEGPYPKDLCSNCAEVGELRLLSETPEEATDD